MTLEQLQQPIYRMEYSVLAHYFSRLSKNDILQMRDYKFAEALKYDKQKEDAIRRGDKIKAGKLQALVNIHHYEACCCFARQLELEGGRYPTKEEVKSYPLFAWDDLLRYATKEGFFTESQSGG